jgi:hypothetical protein
MAKLNFHVTFLAEVSVPGKDVREKTERADEHQECLDMKLAYTQEFIGAVKWSENN